MATTMAPKPVTTTQALLYQGVMTATDLAAFEVLRRLDLC